MQVSVNSEIFWRGKKTKNMAMIVRELFLRLNRATHVTNTKQLEVKTRRFLNQEKHAL